MMSKDIRNSITISIVFTMVNKIMFVLVRFQITSSFPNSLWSFTLDISFSILLEKVSHCFAILQETLYLEQHFTAYIHFFYMKWLSCIIYLLKEMRQAGKYHPDKPEYIERIKDRIPRFCFCTCHKSWEETKF